MTEVLIPVVVGIVVLVVSIVVLAEHQLTLAKPSINSCLSKNNNDGNFKDLERSGGKRVLTTIMAHTIEAVSGAQVGLVVDCCLLRS